MSVPVVITYQQHVAMICWWVQILMFCFYSCWVRLSTVSETSASREGESWWRKWTPNKSQNQWRRKKARTTYTRVSYIFFSLFFINISWDSYQAIICCPWCLCTLVVQKRIWNPAENCRLNTRVKYAIRHIINASIFS